ncbi:MAG: DAK2 domain-containing protein [Eubacteriales bacterium]
MALNTIDAKMLSVMFLAGAKSLEHKKEWINELNVFPVPDGDTGTNMSMTIMAASREVVAIEDMTMRNLSKAISTGSLRGARGNSGVILSQLFRGFTKSIKEKEEITVDDLAVAMRTAVDTAYKAVMKPKEGTILTVAKGAAEKMEELSKRKRTDLEGVFEEVLAHTEYVLSQTPEMLPVLKQAGVVDSGGQGLLEVLKGAYDAFLGKEIDTTITFEPTSTKIDAGISHDLADIKFGYCTEFIILTDKELSLNQETQLKKFLESIGDSIVVVADEEVVKVHVHTNDPGLAIQKALKYGQLSNLKIDNMRLEHLEQVEKQAKAQEALEQASKKAIGFIAVSIGEGMNEIFRELGVDYIIEGGQTMNPSTEDMLEAIAKVNADAVFVLPNNKNIILAANQAQSLVEDKQVVVIPTTTVPQGITAIINFIADLSVEENESAILEEIVRVKTGQVTYAVRDTMIDDKEIKQGDFMGIGDAGILSVGTDLADITVQLAEEMIDPDSELISIYYGSDVTIEDAEAVQARIEAKHKRCDVELQSGGQPIYYYIISVE